MSEKQRKYKKLLCSHCDKVVCKSTWYKHYNELNGERSGLESSIAEFDFGSSSSEESTDNYIDDADGLDSQIAPSDESFYKVML